MSKNKDSVTQERWEYIKRLAPPPPRLIHASDGKYNPISQRFKKGTGNTFDEGRNAAKRAARG